MNNDLVSLSLTDMPFYNRESIRTSDAINILIQTGGTFEYNNTTNLIIGIALLAIAGVIFIGENNYTTANARIDYLNCSSTNCLLGVQFGVNGDTYKKDYTVDMNFIRPSNNYVTVTYELTNPNNNYMGTSNYNIIMYILIGLGLFFIGLWNYVSCNKECNSSTLESTDIIYKKTETPSGLYVVSKKI
jgi:hypothetical protein